MMRVGHRGAAGHVLENTLGSIEKAIELGVDYVEVDIRRTRDGALVVMHDPTLDRTTTGRGAVAATTWEHIKGVRTKDGQHVPVLAEVLDRCNGRVGLMLELKAKGIAADVVNAVAASRFSGPLLYASFHHPDLVRVKGLAPGAGIMPLISRGRIDPAALAGLGAAHVGLRHDRLTAARARALHAAGITVFVYTVNEPVRMRTVMELGADAVISDVPDRCPD
ncbi:glycerophosphodiester phosphodiesterase [Candidatus Nitrospira bockiana]